ncbi:MAG TPA: PQQ-binding-like beta-propeller repeat protein [Verrucomicrobiae bacterium]
MTLAPACASEWSQFRGPSGTGVGEDTSIPLEWSKDRHLAWKTAIPGVGWSQLVTVGALVFVTSAVSEKLARPMDYATGTSDSYTLSGDKASAPELVVQWKVFALDLQTGALKWERSVASGKPKYPVHPSNTYASETPAADARGVYVWSGAAGVIVAFDHTGRRLWGKQLGVFRQQNNVGPASSPRLHEGLIYLQCFNEEQAVLVCFDARDGQERWRRTRQTPGTAWNTPLIWQNARRTELVVCGQKLMTSHDPLTGKEYWRASGPDMPVIPSLSGDTQRLYFGYRSPTAGGPLCALGAGARGEQCPGAGDKTFQSEAWKASDAAPGMPSPLAVSGCVYVLNGNILSCLDAATGKEHFKQRLPGFRAVVASPVSAGDRIVIIDESGNAIVLKAGPEFKVLGQSKLADRFWTSPAIVNDTLLLRGLEYVYRIRD